jgi:hypothetical protein
VLSFSEPVIKELEEDKKLSRDMPECPNQFADLVTKFEASFISQQITLNNILGVAYFDKLTEIKLIQCDAAGDALLYNIAGVRYISITLINF